MDRSPAPGCIVLRGGPRRTLFARQHRGAPPQRVPWAETGSWFTRDFEDQVGFFAQNTDQTSIARVMGVAWRTVGSIIQRVTARLLPADLLDNLKRIAPPPLRAPKAPVNNPGQLAYGSGFIPKGCEAGGFEKVSMKLHLAASRWAQGLLAGGDEGGARVARAREVLISEGVKAPERFAAMLAPGLLGA